MILTIRPATLAEAEWMGAHLREEDRREVETATGQRAEDVLPASFHLSSEVYTIRLAGDGGKPEDDPTVIFGVGDDPSAPSVGVVWLLATSNIRRAPLAIIHEAHHWLDHFNKRYPIAIHNVVDMRNALHIRWLTRTGFDLGDTMQINGQQFIHAIRRSNDV